MSTLNINTHQDTSLALLHSPTTISETAKAAAAAAEGRQQKAAATPSPEPTPSAAEEAYPHTKPTAKRPDACSRKDILSSAPAPLLPTSDHSSNPGQDSAATSLETLGNMDPTCSCASSSHSSSASFASSRSSSASSRSSSASSFASSSASASSSSVGLSAQPCSGLAVGIAADISAPPVLRTGREPSSSSSFTRKRELTKWLSFGDLNLACDAHSWGPLPGFERHVIDLTKLAGKQTPFASGRLGQLYRTQLAHQEVALKIVRCPMPQEEGKESYHKDKCKLASAQKELIREVETLSRLDHPRIVQFVGVSERTDKSLSYMCCIGMEFLAGGSLRDHIRRRTHPFDLPILLSLALDVAHAMAYLHSQGIIHRDLKTPNILLDETRSIAKVADFGTSRRLDPEAELTSETGTFRWMAPEMIQGQEYTNKVDVYSFGIVLWELLTLQFPWDKLSCMQVAFAVAQKGERPPWPMGLSPILVTLAESCWATDPSERPEFEEIVQSLESAQLALPTDPSLMALHLKNPKASSGVTREKEGHGGPVASRAVKGGRRIGSRQFRTSTSAPLTTPRPTTSRPTIAPRTTAPRTTAPPTTAPPSTSPNTTAPPTTAPPSFFQPTESTSSSSSSACEPIAEVEEEGSGSGKRRGMFTKLKEQMQKASSVTFSKSDWSKFQIH